MNLYFLLLSVFKNNFSKLWQGLHCISTFFRNSGDGLLHHGVTIHRSWQEEDLHSCARTRPFMTENFPKTKIRSTVQIE